MSREGSLDAPTRHPIKWRDESFYDFSEINKELERVFDICHGCRRCFNLCDSFPRLFDLIDESATGEVDGLNPDKDYKPVVDGCTLCDMCFMTKCPYVPPHEFDLDFPHLMLRYRAAEKKAHGAPKVEAQLAQMDRNGKALKPVAGLANWGSKRGNALSRPILEGVAGIDKDVELPKFHSKTFGDRVGAEGRATNASAPAAGRKAVIYSTCFVDYNKPNSGLAAQAVLAENGVETEVVYPACCGMPFLEHGDIERVAKQAETVAAEMKPWIEKGYAVIAPTASCGLMLKFEWPLILPDNSDVKALADATWDISQYIVDIAKKEGLGVSPKPVEGGVTLHLACHSRAQNMGQKSAELLALIPDTQVHVVERCSGHGGTFGVMKKTRPLAQKVGKNAVRAIYKNEDAHLCSDCPLGCKHLSQELEIMNDEKNTPDRKIPAPEHPIEIFAAACGLV